MLHRSLPDSDHHGRAARAGVDDWSGIRSRVPASGQATGRRGLGGFAIGPLMGLVTFAFLSWGLGRPAFWLDESASVVATQRSWPDLFRLLQGADAPLVPYYAVLKTTTGFLRALSPGITAHPEVLYRLPSAVAVALACGVLIGWLDRQVPRALVLVTAALLLLTGGLSRYGQEARPYGLVLLGAVSATVLWTAMIRDGRYRWMTGYAILVALMVALHDLTAILVAAHLVAALLVVPEERATAARRTVGAGGAGLLMVSPLALTTAWDGKGASRFVSLTPGHLLTAFVELFSSFGSPVLGLGPIVLLAVLGLTRIWSPRYRFVAGLAAAWALVPPALLLPAVMLRPNLLIARYLLFTVPAWVVLAGLGMVTLAEVVWAVLHRLRVPRVVTVSVATGVVVTVLAATLSAQAPTLTGVRTAQGHGENIRPALAVTTRGADAGLPIVTSSRLGATEVGAYDPAAAYRMVGLDLKPADTMIWPDAATDQVRNQILRRDSRVLLLLRDTSGNCTQRAGVTSEAQITRCMPPVLRRLHYRVLTPGVGGFGWSVSTLVRIRA